MEFGRWGFVRLGSLLDGVCLFMQCSVEVDYFEVIALPVLILRSIHSSSDNSLVLSCTIRVFASPACILCMD